MSKEIIKKGEIIKKESFPIAKFVDGLYDIMVSVCKEKPTAENVHAACNCAGRILDFMKLSLELKKIKGQ